MSSRAIFVVVAGSALLGCGGGTSPDLFGGIYGSGSVAATSGAGGAGTTAVSASSSGGASSSSLVASSSVGSGGTLVGCPALAFAGDPVQTAPDAMNDQRFPTLLLTNANEAVAVFSMPPEGGGASLPGIGDVVVPWNAWPVDLGQPFVVASDGGAGIGDFQATTGDGSGFALLLRSSDDNPSKNYVSTSIPPAMPNASLGTEINETTEPTSPLFLARRPGRYLAATWVQHVQPMKDFQIELRVMDPGPSVAETFVDSGCGTLFPAGAGIPMGDGFLIALSSSRPLGECQNVALLGEPSDLELALWSAANPKALLPGATIPNQNPIGAAELVPRSDGAWVVWQESVPNMAPIHGVRVDALGQIAGPVLTLVNGGTAVGPFAVAGLGDGLAIAYWTNKVLCPACEMTLVVRPFDASGSPGATTSLQLQGDFPEDRIALLGSPNADRVLVAWSVAIAGGNPRLSVARLDCVPP